MARIRVNISLTEELNDRWNSVAEKHDISKSGMIQDFLLEVLPILEETVPSKMMAKAMKKMSATIDDSATLFDKMNYDQMEHDKSIEEYKEDKRK